MSLLACYRKTWAEVNQGRDGWHLRIKAAPELAVPRGFESGLSGHEWFANVRHSDPELHLFRARWCDREISVMRVIAREHQSPLLMLAMMSGDEAQDGIALRSGWRRTDRDILETTMPISDQAIHLDEVEAKPPEGG